VRVEDLEKIGAQLWPSALSHVSTFAFHYEHRQDFFNVGPRKFLDAQQVSHVHKSSIGNAPFLTAGASPETRFVTTTPSARHERSLKRQGQRLNLLCAEIHFATIGRSK
jgi:hypothetical protein